MASNGLPRSLISAGRTLSKKGITVIGGISYGILEFLTSNNLVSSDAPTSTISEALNLAVPYIERASTDTDLSADSSLIRVLIDDIGDLGTKAEFFVEVAAVVIPPIIGLWRSRKARNTSSTDPATWEPLSVRPIYEPPLRTEEQPPNFHKALKALISAEWKYYYSRGTEEEFLEALQQSNQLVRESVQVYNAIYPKEDFEPLDIEQYGQANQEHFLTVRARILLISECLSALVEFELNSKESEYIVWHCGKALSELQRTSDQLVKRSRACADLSFNKCRYLAFFCTQCDVSVSRAVFKYSHCIFPNLPDIAAFLFTLHSIITDWSDILFSESELLAVASRRGIQLTYFSKDPESIPATAPTVESRASSSTDTSITEVRVYEGATMSAGGMMDQPDWDNPPPSPTRTRSGRLPNPDRSSDQHPRENGPRQRGRGRQQSEENQQESRQPTQEDDLDQQEDREPAQQQRGRGQQQEDREPAQQQQVRGQQHSGRTRQQSNQSQDEDSQQENRRPSPQQQQHQQQEQHAQRQGRLPLRERESPTRAPGDQSVEVTSSSIAPSPDTGSGHGSSSTSTNQPAPNPSNVRPGGPITTTRPRRTEIGPQGVTHQDLQQLRRMIRMPYDPNHTFQNRGERRPCTRHELEQLAANHGLEEPYFEPSYLENHRMKHHRRLGHPYRANGPPMQMLWAGEYGDSHFRIPVQILHNIQLRTSSIQQ